MRLAKQRDEEARLAGIVAKTKAQELDAQQQQAIAHTRQRAEQASRAAKEEIAAREELSAAEHAAALERAAARTAMEGQSRGAAVSMRSVASCAPPPMPPRVAWLGLGLGLG